MSTKLIDSNRVLVLDSATRILEEAGLTMHDVTEVTIQKRVSDAYEQARPILFMLSDWSSFISGHNLSVDGGWVV